MVVYVHYYYVMSIVLFLLNKSLIVFKTILFSQQHYLPHRKLQYANTTSVSRDFTNETRQFIGQYNAFTK